MTSHDGRIPDAWSALLSSHFDVDALEHHQGAIYAVSADWRLVYMNGAWSRFAAENDGEPAISAHYGRGASLLDALTPEYRAFYEAHYLACRQSGRVWRHEYDCSSPTVHRRFQQLAYPLPDDALLIVNSCLVELPVGVTPPDADSACAYRDVNGLIHQCAHCRRVSASADAMRWDWVPAWAADIPRSASHTFCPTCAGFYYPPSRRR